MTVFELHAALGEMMKHIPSTANHRVAIRPADGWERIGKVGLIKGGIIAEAEDTQLVLLLAPIELNLVGGF